ncbi:benzoylformate decarboxylase [Nocardia altamirensis]|uniref:benzoylformate decarboxylase n=1 Tax=Nocardia altamirensis TaxID=472158 RepID=UPI00083FF066|nr:benzoylformate decarboxylase [Nocardia altamirensis]
MTTVREATLDLFRAHGITTWFGNPGSSELSLLQDFPDDMRYFLGLQEMVPVGMADGYAQISGRPVLVNLHTAPGSGNAQGALYNAYMNKSPLIVTAGNQRRIMQNQNNLLTNIDPTTVPKPFVKWSAEPAIASETPAVLAHAIHLAQTPPTGPVYVSLPMDDMDVELTDEQVADTTVVARRRVVHATGFPDALARELAARINAAKNPALVVGMEVDQSNAWDSVIALAERINAVVWNAPLAGTPGFPSDHPQYRGPLLPGRAWVTERLEGHDLVVVIGSAVFRYYPYMPGPYLPKGTELIHFTNDPDEAARAPIGDAYVTDATAAVAAILAHVTVTDRPRPPARPQPPAVTLETAPMSPEALWGTVGRVAPADALYVSEAGSNEAVLPQYLHSSAPLSHLFGRGDGLGWGLPAALGAQLAAPDRPVIAAMGDGSMHYAISALSTAAQYRIPVTIVVASNAEYGILKLFAGYEKTAGVPGLDLPPLDIVSIANGYGVDTHEAGSTDELADMLKVGITDRDRPTLINVRTTPVAQFGP